MSCKYTVEGITYESYQALVDSLSSGDIDDTLSILFSLVDRQQATYDAIIEKAKEHKYEFKRWKTASIDGEPSVDVKDAMSIQQFIDSHYFMVNGKPPMFKMVFDQYLEHKKEELVKSHKMSEEDAEMHIRVMRDRWEIIANDAYDFHKLVVGVRGKKDELTYTELSTNAVGTSFQNIVDKVEVAASEIIKQVFLKNGTTKTESGKTGRGRLIKNINLSAYLKGFDEKIIGHIDYLMIRDDGEIEIFLIKTSSESYSDWDTVKKEKYRYQMALLKRILEYNGIPAKNMRMNIIPVKLTYDSNYEHVTDIDVESTVSMDFKDGAYTLHKYDKVAEQFIASTVTVDDLDSDTAIKLHSQLQRIFPGRDISAFGVKETAKTWLERHWKQLKPTPTDDGGWEITIPGDKTSIKVSDPRVGSKNEEILNIINDRLNDLSANIQNEKGIYRIISDIRNAYKKTGFYNPSGEYGFYLGEQFSKYFDYGNPKVREDGTFDYTWEIIENDVLLNAGILLFRNKYTSQVDVVTLTNYDVTLEYKFKGRDNLLGYYLPDLNNEQFTMKSNYGNIEAIRTMVILNEVLPHINGNLRLGELKVLGVSHQIHGKKGVLYDLSRLAPQFDTIVQVVSKNTDIKITNNFKEQGFKYVDQVDILIQQWQEIISTSKMNLTEIKALDQFITQRHLVDGTSIDGLLQVGTAEAKVEKLELLIDKLRKLAHERGIKIGETRQLLEMSRRGGDNLNTAIATLYIAAVKALNQYYGDLSLENENFGGIQEWFLKNNSINNSNVRQVGFMFQRTIDKIANDMVARYTPIRDIFMEFYEASGYTKTQNALIGNQASVYINLYEKDNNGNRTMQFKNPYDDYNDLKDHERKFLKRILYEFHKVRCEMLGRPNNITGPDDPKLKTDMPKEYLNAPLERASAATRRSQIDKGIQQWGKRMSRMFTKPGEFFEEMQGLVDEKEIRQRSEDIKNLQAYNPFKNSEASLPIRNAYILDKEVDYFEYNVENLFIDYLEKHIQSTEYSKMLVRAKGIELDLILRGETEDDEVGIERTLKAINDFLDINVFNKSIMGEDAQKVEAFLAPLRSAVSALYVAGNVAGAVRDTFQGLLENITSAIIKFQTNIGVDDVAFGYKEVMSEGVGNLMTMTKLNQFCIKYRLSNLDVARISEGQKTGRGGILNADQWAYATLRGPDYLNRMVLFVAKMHHDGCYDAYKLTDEKRLEYDWREDKRFNVYAKGEEGKKANPEEYKKQKALYYSLIRAFNMEGYRKPNGEQLNYTDDLPDAYTLQEIQTFKTFSDNIYGSYNKSTKAKYEHHALGRNFAFFSTWMNGIVDVYMKDTQVSQGEVKLEQEYDYNGNLLFFTEDGQLTTEDTGIPVMHGVPIMVQGIFATLRDIYKTFKHCGMDEHGNWSFSRGLDAVKTDLWSNEVVRRNWRKFLSHILIGGLLSALFKLWLDEEYRDHKANDSGKNVVTNAAIEVLYKASSSCFDTFLGPMAIYDYIGNQTNPATYRIQSKVVNDLYNFVIGEKTAGQILMNSQALPRTFQDTYKMWVRDTKSTTEE